MFHDYVLYLSCFEFLSQICTIMYHLAGLGSRKSSLAPASLVFLTECSMCFSVRRSGRYSPRKTRQSFGHLLSDFCSVHGSCFIHVHAISCQGLSYAMLDPHRSKGPLPIPLNGFSHGPSAVVLPPFFFSQTTLERVAGTCQHSMITGHSRKRMALVARSFLGGATYF